MKLDISQHLVTRALRTDARHRTSTNQHAHAYFNRLIAHFPLIPFHELSKIPCWYVVRAGQRRRLIQ